MVTKPSEEKPKLLPCQKHGAEAEKLMEGGK